MTITLSEDHLTHVVRHQDGPPTRVAVNQVVSGGPSTKYPDNHGRSDGPANAVSGETLIVATDYHGGSSVSPHSLTLIVLTQMLGDIETVRVANENRLRSLPEGFEVEARFIREQVAQTRVQEKVIVRELERAMKAHPLGEWVERNLGLGFKTCGRLIGMLGDVYWNPLTDTPRSLGQLNAYCGLHVIDGAAARRTKGVQSNWNTKIKALLWVMADSAFKKNPSRLRDIYLARREHTNETHPDWTKGHSHNDALRVLSKSILKSLWLASRNSPENL